jgi:DNA-binding NarL/FixJ family response regulator
MINILIADDHPIIRYGLKQIILNEQGMSVSGEAETASQVFDLLQKNEYDILILDIGLPDFSGLEVLGKMKYIKPHLPVLVLSAMPEDLYAVRVIKAGASGYLNKNSATENLIPAIKKIISGKNYISPHLTENLVSALKNDKGEKTHDNLSPREFEILCLIGSGKTVKNIAEELCLGIPTVYTYRTRILEKMNLNHDSELVQYCIKEGIIL